MRWPRGILLVSSGAVGAILLIALLIILRMEHSKRELVAYHSEREAKGERLDGSTWAAFPPGDSNEAANQLAAGIADLLKEVNAKPYKPFGAGMSPAKPGTAEIDYLRPTVRRGASETSWADLEQTMSDYGPHLDLVRESLQTQTPVFRIDSSSVYSRHLSGFTPVAQLLGADSMLDLRAGRTSDAVKNIQAILLLAKVAEGHPNILDQLVYTSLMAMASHTTWDVLQSPASAEDLQALQKSWDQPNPAHGIIPALRRGRAWTAGLFASGDQYLLLPSSRTSSNIPQPGEMWKIVKDEFQMRTSRYSDELTTLRGFDAIISVTQLPDWRTMTREIQAINTSTSKLPLSRNIVGGLLSTVEGIAATDTIQKLAITAIAIRRYQLEHSGQLPATLEDLVPRYLSAIPRDIMDGTPLRYKPEGETYLLYAVGFDGADDGGKPEAPAGRIYRDYVDGQDIVWPKPVPSQPLASGGTPP